MIRSAKARRPAPSRPQADPFPLAAPLPPDDGVAGDMLDEMVGVIRGQLGLDVAFIAEIEDGRHVFRHLALRDGSLPLEPGSARPLDETYCQRILDGRLPELIPDTAREPEAMALAATRAIGIRSHVGVPIRFSDGRLYGTFCCFGTTPAARPLQESDLGALRAFATLAGHLLERQWIARKDRRETVARLHAVIDRKLFGIVYQPIVVLSEDRIVGYEALTRFSAEPQRPPDRWFLEAAGVGLQEALEAAALGEALKGLAHFPAGRYISLNASPATILSGRVAAVLAGQPLGRLMLEVTEQVSVDDYGPVAAALAPLRAAGLRLAVDDAGAGYASFRHILKLKPDIIKLDRSLIARIDDDRHCRALAAALIRFAEETGSRIVAEGVETEAELAVLRELKVDKAQGYLLGRPLPIGQVRL